MPLFARRSWPAKLARLAAASVLVVVVVVALAWFFARPVIERRVREKLIALVDQQLNAKLEIKTLRYRWPYGVQIDAAALHSATPGEPSIKLVGFDRLDLQLARLPIGDGPLVIERIDVRRPTLYAVETKADGFVGLERLFKERDEKRQKNADKLSDVLQLRQVQLTDARIEYDDRTIRRSVPFVWDRLNLRLSGEPKGGGLIYFNGGAGNGDTLRVDAKGSIDLDKLWLELDALNLTARVHPKGPQSPLPAGVQRVLNTLGVAGGGRATVSGHVPLEESKNLHLWGDFVIDDAQGRLSREGRPLSDLALEGGLDMNGRVVTVDVARFEFRRGPAFVSFLPNRVQYDLAKDQWTVTALHGAAAYFPPPGTTGVLNQRATATFIANLRQVGERDHFTVNVEGTKLSFPDTVGDLSLAGYVTYDDTGITLNALGLTGLGGDVTLEGFVNDTGGGGAGELIVRDGDLDKINRLMNPGTTRTLAGTLRANVKAAATDDLENVRGNGQFRVTGGTFIKVPVLGGLADRLRVGRNAFTAHEASGRFTLDPKGVAFQRLAVNTDVLSVVGTGDVSYDGDLNLSVYADGHWRDRPRADAFYVPVLSDIGRALAGVGQYTVGSISRQITHFTVTGDASTPKITLSPAPVVGESLEKLFGGD